MKPWRGGLDRCARNAEVKGFRSNMEYIKGIFVTLQEYRRGQTMTEYALILAAVAVVVFAGYQLMGTDINNLLSTVDSSL